MNKQEALDKIEELKQFVEEYDKEEKEYSYVEGETYSTALQKLASDERPPTLKELMKARIQQPKLFKVYLDTCTTIIKNDKGLLKINPISKELLTLPKDFKKACLEVDWEECEGVVVNPKKVSSKEIWLLAMGGDSEENNKLYDDYKKALLKQNKSLSADEVMNFYG